MPSPELLAFLHRALDEIHMAHTSLDVALEYARLSTLHSTYTAALERILAFNKQAIESTQNLLTVLQRRARQPHP